MKTIGNNIYVHLPTEKNDTIRLNSGLELFVDTSFDVLHQTRQTGFCVATNELMQARGIEVGMEILFSHHVAVDMNYQEVEKSNKDDEVSKIIGVPSYICPDYFIYAYRKPNEKWQPFGDFIFVSPIKYDVEQLPSGLFIPPLQEYYDRIGRVLIGNEGAVEGAYVFFEKDADYELRMKNGTFTSLTDKDGEVVWRMRTVNILAVFDNEQDAKKLSA